ncbi:MAG: hypothetical protein NC390_06935 [Fusobacterium sp.]|nr:hypothetical protein [Fusobacterium sp.]
MINSIGQNQPAFKGIVLKNIPPKTAFSTMVDFVQAGDLSRIIKGANKRLNRDVLTLDITTSKNPIVRCLTPEIEEKVFNNLSAKRDMLPGVELQKINDWTV